MREKKDLTKSKKIRQFTYLSVSFLFILLFIYGIVNVSSLVLTTGTNHNNQTLSKFNSVIDTFSFNKSTELRLSHGNVSRNFFELLRYDRISVFLNTSSSFIAIDNEPYWDGSTANKTFVAIINMTPGASEAAVFSKGSANTAGFILSLNPISRTIRAKLNNVNYNSSTNAFEQGTETMIAWVFNDTDVIFYSNKTNVNMGFNNWSSDNVNILAIGAQSNNPVALQFNGTIRNAIIFNKTLSKQEIEGLYYNDGLNYPGLANSTIAVNGKAEQRDDGSLLLWDNVNLSLSLNAGATSTDITTVPTLPTGTAIIVYENATNTTYLSYEDTGQVWKSSANSITAWSNVVNLSCDAGGYKARFISTAGGLTRAINGDLYIASYTLQGGANNESCGHIYKSTNNGASWTINYNDTAVYQSYGTKFFPARHNHGVWSDPYTGHLYSSMGDGIGKKRFLRSVNNGTTWNLIFHQYEHGISWQPTMVGFTPNYIFIGEDISPFADSSVDQWSRIARSPRTSNLTQWEIVFNDDEEYSGYIEGPIYGQNNEIYAFWKSAENTTAIPIVATNNEFNDTWVAFQFDKSSFPAGSFAQPSRMVNNTFYISDPVNSDALQLKSINRTTRVLGSWRLQENKGTVVYDSSGRGNNGTLNGTFAWRNANTTKIIYPQDYKLNDTSGNITLWDDNWNFADVRIHYNYYTWSSIFNNLQMYFTHDFDNSTTAYDNSSNNRNGLYNTASNGSNCGVFLPGGCSLYDGSGNNEEIRLVNGSWFNVDEVGKNITVLMWFNASASAGALFGSHETTGRPSWVFGANGDINNTLLQMRFNNGSDSQVVDVGNVEVALDNFYHAAIVIKNNGTALKLRGYMDGWYNELENVTLPPGGYYNESTASVLGGFNTWTSWNGSIDEFMVFDTELETPQIQYLMGNPGLNGSGGGGGDPPPVNQSSTYVCTTGDRSTLNLILIAGALLMLLPLIFVMMKVGGDITSILDEFDIKTLLVIFIVIVTGAVFLITSAQNIGTVCGT